jgi:hypothetical protein
VDILGGSAVQFRFESILPAVVLALVLVGMPAIILKQSAIWFLRTERDGPRLKLLWLSIGAGAAIGIATIVFHAWLSGSFEFNAYPVFRAFPTIEAGTAIVLLVLISAADGFLWQNFVARNGPQSARTASIWLIGGNAWIPWALLLMHFWRQSNGFLD